MPKTSPFPDPATVTAPAPTDLFSTDISDALDDARQILDDVGLRPYQTFLVLDTWTGPRKREGVLESRKLIPITPPPRVRFVSTREQAAAGGRIQEGTAVLSGISRRTYNWCQLHMKGSDGNDLAANIDFHYALLAKGEKTAELYKPSGDAVLGTTQWGVVLQPTNRREVLVEVSGAP